jgi:hypothetical protein
MSAAERSTKPRGSRAFIFSDLSAIPVVRPCTPSRRVAQRRAAAPVS